MNPSDVNSEALIVELKGPYPGMHGNADENGCVECSENEISKLKGLVASAWITVEEKADPVVIEKGEIDFVVVVAIVGLSEAIELDSEG